METTQEAYARARQGVRDTRELLNVVAYVVVSIGLLLAVLTTQRLTLAGVGLLVAANLIWLWAFRRLDVRSGDERALALSVLAMTASALLVEVVPWFVVNFDWMLVLVVVGVVASISSLRRALAFGGVLWLLTMVNLLLLNWNSAGAVIENIVTMTCAFVFVVGFSVVARQEAIQRERAEQLVAQLEDAQAQLRAYASQVEELTVARERNRMAREIHDTLGHYLTILAVRLETALKLEERSDARLRTELTESRQMATECLAEVRRSVVALRLEDPTEASFSHALARLAEEFEVSAPEVELVLDVEGPLQSLAPEQRVALYRCAQESLTNIRRHAQATKVLLRVRVDERQAELTVLDNGRGADSSADGHAPGFGLLGMSERIRLLGGTVTVGPGPDRGWRVEAQLPRAAAVALASEPAAHAGTALAGVAVADGAEVADGRERDDA